MHKASSANKRVTVSSIDSEVPKQSTVQTTTADNGGDSTPSRPTLPFTMDILRDMWSHWKSRDEFVRAQVQVAGILLTAWIGNNWPHSYPRNDNENPAMFGLMNILLVVAAAFTMKHEPSTRGVVVLNRNQTEEWKGWMQWAFIMYHYYRARFVYNEIRVFVSSYVFLTGWGNWQYFDKKKDFSLERAVSMWLRINYFPLLLCLVVGTKLDDFYIVPLHTTGFFITMATAYLAHCLETVIPKNTTVRNATAIAISLLVHILFFETPAVNFLKIFSQEIFFRFQADKYSTWCGICAGFLWTYVKKAAQYYNTASSPTYHQNVASLCQAGTGLTIMLAWYGIWGSNTDKFTYNPVHPYIFWMPIAGWLMIRNSTKYLTEIHSTVLEFFGRITLETYVLQFHLFMCRHVQHIPIVVPGSGPDGSLLLKTVNMLLTGTIFVTVAYYARQGTVATQTAAMELMVMLRQYYKTGQWPQPEGEDQDDIEAKKPLVATTGGAASPTSVVEQQEPTKSAAV